MVFPTGLDSILSVAVIDANTKQELGVGHARVGDLQSRAEETAAELPLTTSPNSPETGSDIMVGISSHVLSVAATSGSGSGLSTPRVIPPPQQQQMVAQGGSIPLQPIIVQTQPAPQASPPVVVVQGGGGYPGYGYPGYGGYYGGYPYGYGYGGVGLGLLAGAALARPWGWGGGWGGGFHHGGWGGGGCHGGGGFHHR